MFDRVILVAGAVALAAGPLPAAAQSRTADASADTAAVSAPYTGCPGRLIGYDPITAGKSGPKIGQLYLYYDRSVGYCATTRHVGPTYGVFETTGVALYSNHNTGPNGLYETKVRDHARRDYRAGPVKYNPGGQCVFAGGGVGYGANYYVVYTQVHCGGD